MSTRAFLKAIVRAPHDKAPRLMFADWLAEHGDPHRAAYIRARCALDGCVPEGDEYPTLIENSLESVGGEREPEFVFPPGFKFDNNMEGGFPSFVRAEPDGDDTKIDPALLVERVAELVRTTPVRGIDFGRFYPRQLPAVFASPAALQLRRLSFWSRPSPYKQSSGLIDVAGSPVARVLTHLGSWGAQYGHLTDRETQVLAFTPFEQLEGLTLRDIGCSPTALERLQMAPWFRRLRQVALDFKQDYGEEAARRLAEMPHLHTLTSGMTRGSFLRGLGSTGEFPELRRMFIHCANLKGEQSAALARMKAPKLIDLSLWNSAFGLTEIKTMAASPLFNNLRILTFNSEGLTQTGLAPIAANPCARGLRMLKIQHAKMRSLAKSALARPGAFPSLTSLVLRSPFSSSAKGGDTAALLAELDTPNLRHLTLEYCDFDDTCADLLATSPVFAKLRRLVVRSAARGDTAPRQQTLLKMFRSDNLRNLVVLEMWDVPVGEAAEVFADPATMPGLSMCVLDDVPEITAKTLAQARPIIRCVK